MTDLHTLLANLRSAADYQTRGRRGPTPNPRLGAELNASADMLAEAVEAFNPDIDLVGGVRAMGCAISRAKRVYEDATGRALIEVGQPAKARDPDYDAALAKVLRKPPPWDEPEPPRRA